MKAQQDIKRMDLNELARRVTELEGKKIPLSIAQVKEVIRCLGLVLWQADMADVLRVLARLVDVRKLR